MFVLCDAAISAARWTRQALFLERAKRFADRIFVERHYRIAIVFLIAGIHQRIERERVVVGGGDVLLDERTEDANFDFTKL